MIDLALMRAVPQVQLLGQLQKCRIESTAITHAAVLSSLGWRMAVDFLQDMRRESFAFGDQRTRMAEGFFVERTRNSTNE